MFFLVLWKGSASEAVADEPADRFNIGMYDATYMKSVNLTPKGFQRSIWVNGRIFIPARATASNCKQR